MAPGPGPFDPGDATPLVGLLLGMLALGVLFLLGDAVFRAVRRRISRNSSSPDDTGV